jgi:hypothetical protein
MARMIDEIKRRAEAAARELDEKYEIKSKLNQGARTAADAVRKGSDAASSAFDAARAEVGRIDQEHKISERVGAQTRRATDAAKEAFRDSGAGPVVDGAVKDAKEAVSEAVNEAKDLGSDMFGGARRFYEGAAGAARAGTSAARLPWSLRELVSSSKAWINANPGKAAIISLAVMAGTRAGSALATLDVVVLGAGGSGNWLFHSALIPYGLRKLADKYESYLKRQEDLVRKGELAEAEQKRVEFERDMAKYIGAPLLGAFSVAAGAGLVYEAFAGGAVTGFPVNLVLGGNPLLTSIWLFGNGLVCFHNGYRFFMMALGDQEEVARVVRDIKALIPEATVTS